ncbi:MAG: cytochrome b/b6 domain-containing protein [Desulfovibrio sp.]|jgi:thiosulfate reductase cytochrome b subunit|nr:cytochrome b/b6 domain-containing protein [Desulfovibrio sp.]
MRLLRAIVTAALLVLFLPGAAQATDKGATLKYGGGGLGTVLFDGGRHAGKGYVCKDCHLDLFVTKKQARVLMSDHFSDNLCFRCHDNSTASKDCITCHRDVPSSGMTASDYMRGAMTQQVAGDEERQELLGGQNGASGQTRACLSCHSDPNLRPVSERGKSLNLLVQQGAYGIGAHGALPCVTCHFGLEGAASFTRRPHALNRSVTVDCKSCHAERLAPEVASFDESVHIKKTGEKFVCANCHDAHSQPRHGCPPAWLDAVAQYNSVCQSCHMNPERFAQFSTTPLNPAGIAHSFLVKFKEHDDKVLCADCHSPVDSGGLGREAHHILEKGKALRDCAACHRNTDSLIISRVALRDGNADALSGSYIPALSEPASLDRAGFWAFLLLLGVIMLHVAFRLCGKKTAPAGLVTSEFVYPAPIRLFHWINAVGFLLLLWTGLGIHFEGLPLVPALETSARIHNGVAWVLIANFAVFLLYGIFTGDIRQYVPRGPDLAGKIAAQARYYLYGIFSGAKKPFPISRERRFNPLQQVCYLVVFIIGMPVLLLSGALLLLPESATSGLAGRETLASAHYGLAIAFGLFLAAHLYMTTTGDSITSLIRGMITGRHEQREKKDEKSEEDRRDSG